jgi:hypothetical protein
MAVTVVLNPLGNTTLTGADYGPWRQRQIAQQLRRS